MLQMCMCLASSKALPHNEQVQACAYISYDACAFLGNDDSLAAGVWQVALPVRPSVDGRCVVCGAEYELRCAIVT